MTSVGDWGEIIDEADANRFVGREQELVIFRQQMMLARPDYLIFYISGQAGVGKSTLLNRYRDVAKDLGFLSVDCDELQREVPAVLGRFAYQLAEQGHSLKRFDERFRVYRQKMNEIENDPEAPQGLAALLGRTVVRAAFVGGDMVPGVRKGLEYLPQDALETQASEWSTYIIKKFTNKDELALLKEPVSVLSPLFFEDLNEVARKRSVLLCFENFEATKQELQQWLLRLREYRPSRNVRLLIAGRDLPSTSWDSLRGVMLNIQLDIFTEKEAEDFLDTYKVIDIRRRKEILEASDRLPILMSWFTVQDGNWLDASVPTHDIVGRFLRWDNDQVLRQAALLASFPRTFNVDILELLLGSSGEGVNLQYVFDWLQAMPFVRPHMDGWKYHDVVRRKMLHYQRQKSPQNYCHYHKLLAEFYDASRLKLGLSNSEQWANERWRKDTLAYAYHLLAADPVRYWGNIMSIFAMAIRKRRTFALEIIEVLCLNDVLDELSRDQKGLVELFRQQLLAVMRGTLQDGLKMFRRLSSVGDLLPDAKGCMFTYCGECYRLDIELEKAIGEFDEAINLVPNDDWAIAGRGQTYRAMGRYEEALADFNQAVALNKKSASIIANRGEIYGSMGCYEEALADFNQAVALNEKYTWAIAGRGHTYRAMKRYEEALIDFNRAIALNEKNVWAIAGRGETYYAIEHYEEALADFNRAIALDQEYVRVIVRRGRAYRLMKHYEEALADFDRAIALNEKYITAIASRGETYCAIEHYEEALIDFNRAIALDEKYIWAIAHRGHTYRTMKRYEEALADFNRAVELDEKYAWAIAGRGQTYRAMGRYKEALLDLKQAVDLGQDLMNDLGLVFSYLGRYAEAVECYKRNLDKEPDSISALYNTAVVMVPWKGFPLALEWIDKARASLVNTLDTGRKFYGLGGLEALVGNDDLALDHLRQAASIEEGVIDWARHDIAWRNLRPNTEFQAIISKHK